MSNRIEKRYIRPRHFKTISYDITLELIFQSPIKMAPYHYYKNKRFICFSYFIHSNRCFEYVRNNQSYYDVQGLSIFQLYKIAVQYSKTEFEFV